MVTRRGFLTGATVVAGGSALAACTAREGGAEATKQASISTISLAQQVVPFDGPRQAGIGTPHQATLNLVAFTIRAGVDRSGVARLLRLWTEDARKLTQGQTPVGSLEHEMSSSPANLTITCGFGSRFFDIAGIADQRPEWLHPIPHFDRDQLDDQWGEADLVLQVCSDDAVTLSHATRHMIRSGVDYVSVRWFQSGFLNANGVLGKEETPRNLFGQKDGTVNPRGETELDDFVWIDEGPEWIRDGTCMVVRRIAMDLDDWEILDRNSREVAAGRTLDSGAPLTGTDEFDDADFTAVDAHGLPVIDPASHMARAQPAQDNPEQVILRRVFNYDLPPDPTAESLSTAGLVFICFQKNPELQFTAIQQRLDAMDRLNQWITHIGSAVFLIAPGTDPADPLRDDYWGAALLKE